MNFKDYQDCNFIVVVNLEKMHITEGMLQLKMKFSNPQNTKKVLIWMPVYDRKLVIDKNLDVKIE